MAARRYEISFRVLINIFQHEKRNFVSPSGHVIFYLLYKHQWNTTSFHERHRKVRFSYVTIATVIFSRVKITCYIHVWRYHVFHLVFHWCLHNKYVYIWASLKAELLIYYSNMSLFSNAFYNYYTYSSTAFSILFSPLILKNAGHATSRPKAGVLAVLHFGYWTVVLRCHNPNQKFWHRWLAIFT